MEVVDTKARLAGPRPLIRPAVPADFRAMIKLSASSKVFTEAELESLLVDFAACDPGEGDRLLVHQAAGKGPAQGFVQYSPAPITDGSWYIYWIAVAKTAQGCGIGAALLTHAEDDLRRCGARQILIETSAKPAYSAARSLYLRCDYQLVARIPDYYAAGDDKCIFCKKL